MRERDLMTDAWKYYELGRQFNNSMRPGLYQLVDTNNEFYNGNQWINLPDNDAMRRLPKPVFNIIKRVTSLFVATLTTAGAAVSLQPLSEALTVSGQEAAEIADDEIRSLFEKFKMDYRIRDALTDGAITGDYAAHFFFDPSAKPYNGAYGAYRGEIEMELVEGTEVMFGNPNIREVEKQPYILIIGRDTVENLKAEAVRWAKRSTGAAPSGEGEEPVPEEISSRIVPDTEDTRFGIGGSGHELNGDDDRSSRATYIYLYVKKRHAVQVPQPDGSLLTESRETVHVTKATRTAVIYGDVDTGLSRYPVAWGNWQRQKHNYHGRALVTEVVPNQILINQMIAMIFRHLQTQAFPTRLYNADMLSGVSNEVGTAIGVRNLMPGQTLGAVMTTLPASDMSNQIVQAIELCMSYTKECLGATDAQLGSASATNTSALMVLQNNSEVPLENVRSNLYEWVEDCAAILLDMMGTYYGDRPVLRKETVREPFLGPDGTQLADPLTGLPATVPATRETVRSYNFRQLKELYFNIRINVGATSYYSEIAAVQTLDNLRRDGVLDLVDYLERLPEGLIARKDELIEKARSRSETQGAASGDGGYAVGGSLDAVRKLAGLPGNLQTQYGKLPKKAQDALTK